MLHSVFAAAEDGINTLLLAQLSAYRKYPHAAQLMQREQDYQSVLESLAWTTMQAPYSAQEVCATFSITDLLLSQSTHFFDPEVVSGFADLGSEIKNSIPAPEALTVWRDRVVSQVHVEHDASTACAKVDESQVCVKFVVLGQGPTLNSLRLRFITPTDLQLDFLNQEVVTTPHTPILVQVDSYALNKRHYQDYRAAVIAKLGDKRAEYVMPWRTQHLAELTEVKTP